MVLSDNINGGQAQIIDMLLLFPGAQLKPKSQELQLISKSARNGASKVNSVSTAQ